MLQEEEILFARRVKSRRGEGVGSKSPSYIHLLSFKSNEMLMIHERALVTKSIEKDEM